MRSRRHRSAILTLLLMLAAIGATAQSNEAVRTLAQREKRPLLDTLKALVEIESGVDRAAPLLAHAADHGHRGRYGSALIQTAVIDRHL
jgi:hypothetical protein